MSIRRYIHATFTARMELTRCVCAKQASSATPPTNTLTLLLLALQVPDPICLSYTHDPDYGEYKVYPKGKGPKPGAREMHVKRFTPSEAAAKAAELKARGTVDFKEKTYDAAASKYSAGVDYVVEAGSAADFGLMSSLLLNEAQCRLHMKEHGSVQALCSRVLEREPENVKALYRRALAHLECSEYLEAKRDLTSAAKIDPKNRDVRTKLAACKEAAEEQRTRERKLYSAMLSGGGTKEAANAKEEAVEMF